MPTPATGAIRRVRPGTIAAAVAAAGMLLFPLATLGRGGTDLSAVFFAARLDAHRVRLIKDVDGVYAEDPAKNPRAQRYSQMGYDQAARTVAALLAGAKELGASGVALKDDAALPG